MNNPMRFLLPAVHAALLLFACPVFAAQPSPQPPEVRSAIVMNLNTGRILFEKDPDTLVPPASLTKVMTLFLVQEAIEKGQISYLDKVKISRRADRTGGSSMGIVTGQEVTVWDLLKGMAVGSGNDACVAVAEIFPGGLEAFVRQMNEKARFLGMGSTLFGTPNGLPAKGQVTTARDMLRLACEYLRRFPQALRLHSMKYTWYGNARLRNRNRLLGTCPGVDGLKTGYVRASGYNSIVTVKRDGIRLLMVILGARTAGQRQRMALQLMETCFAKAECSRPSVVLKQPETQNSKVVWIIRHGSATILHTTTAAPHTATTKKTLSGSQAEIPEYESVVDTSGG